MVVRRLIDLARAKPASGAEEGVDAYSRRLARIRSPRHGYVAPEGERLYAIGDIHGRDDLLGELLAMIDADNAARRPARTTLVFLGDYVDRGLNSRGVIEALMALEAAGRRAVFLMGNHEEVLLLVARGDRRAAGLFDQVGGRETLLSYGIDEIDYEGADAAGLAELIRTHVPAAHLRWMQELTPSYQAGGYLFVHAGIRPGVAMEDQKNSDLRWIRSEFLDNASDHGALIIHGHSITPEVEMRENRIGIDTGAYASGRLTALGMEDGERWILQTAGNADPSG
ncbi:metallophosphoesterase family protein [Sphingomonas quercus]|uniref:Serine/threonine protein phosphatase n=1 Tax=Sphingomonas quercus TaxID=2842451 RepID=A0ABS6BHE6_9SPHN|nr:metallophosphoesterase family protein [Sphingomonas quercus]MBU3077735.1 serine/threonine protein phosphatase [Sphingomonas quercus]